MSRPDVWMPFYVSDYLRDTGHLSAAEHGAYVLLLIQAWTRSGRLPVEDIHLQKMSRMTPREWRVARSTILAFFTRDGDAWTHKRIIAELDRAAAYSATRRSNVMQRHGRKKRGASGNGEFRVHVTERSEERSTVSASGGNTLKTHEDAAAVGYTCKDGVEHVSTPSPSPSQVPTEQERVLANSLFASVPEAAVVAPIKGIAADFEGWWREYPRKVSKDAASRAYAKARKGASAGELLLALRQQVWPDEARFVPHPATWLNGGRWKDDPTAAAPLERPDRRRETTAERLARMEAEDAGEVPFDDVRMFA